MTVKDGVSPEQVNVELNSTTPPHKSKAQLKAERREKQEAQRAVKQKLREQQPNSAVNSNQKPTSTKAPSQEVKQPQKQIKTILPDAKNKEKLIKKVEQDISTKVEILSHLKQYDKNSMVTRSLSYTSSPVHPAFVRLGVQYARELVVGSNARCAALICAVKCLLERYRCPKSKELRTHLNVILKPNFNYLGQCRKMSVSMENFIKHIKYLITHVDPECDQDKARDGLLEACDTYFRENIYLAAQAISSQAINRIEDGDTILIFNRSQLIMKILLAAHKAGIKFRVMVVDSRPDLRGVKACERLTGAGIQCSYVYINSVTYIMKETTKVLLAADAILANGYVLGPVGTAMICLIAHTYNKPVIVCCETYKFSERVQTDSILFNELADPDDMLRTKTGTTQLSDWRDDPKLHLVNLVYDATPPKLVSIVITEVAELPCSSAPVILRRDNHRYG